MPLGIWVAETSYLQGVLQILESFLRKHVEFRGRQPAWIPLTALEGLNGQWWLCAPKSERLRDLVLMCSLLFSPLPIEEGPGLAHVQSLGVRCFLSLQQLLGLGLDRVLGKVRACPLLRLPDDICFKSAVNHVMLEIVQNRILFHN